MHVIIVIIVMQLYLSALYASLGVEENRSGRVVFMTAGATTPPLAQNRNLAIIARWLPHGLSRSQIEASIQDRNAAAVEWVDFSQLANIDLQGRYCVIIDHPNEHYLTKLTTESFEGMKRLTPAADVL